jgi:stage III sporulation protein AD
MNTLQLCGAAIAAVMLILIIKQGRAEFSPLISLGVCLALFAAAAASLYPVSAYIGEMTSGSLLEPYAGVLLKALGVGLVTQTAAEVCRDSGETAIAGKVELLGKAEIMLLSLPLLRELLQVAGEVMTV